MGSQIKDISNRAVAACHGHLDCRVDPDGKFVWYSKQDHAELCEYARLRRRDSGDAFMAGADAKVKAHWDSMIQVLRMLVCLILNLRVVSE